MDPRPARKFRRGTLTKVKYVEVVTTAVAGVTHEGRFIRCGKARKQWEKHGSKAADKRLEIKRDADNKFDKNAIGIWWSGVGQLGFVPAKIAAIFSPLIDKGLEVLPTIRHFGEFLVDDKEGEFAVTFVKIGLAVKKDKAQGIRKKVIKELGKSGQRWRILVEE